MTLALTAKTVRGRRSFFLGSVLIRNYRPFALVLKRHFRSRFAFHLFNFISTFLDHEVRRTLLHLFISDPLHLLELLQALVYSQHMIIRDEIRITRNERIQDNICSKLFPQRTVKLLRLLNIARHTEYMSVKRAALSHLMTQQRFSHLKFLDQETLYIKLIFFVLCYTW
jgi:hypothetical protein